MYSDLTYTITSGAIEIAVTPIISDLIFSGQEDEALGSYVQRIEGEMLFAGADYSTLYNNWEASGACAALPFNVKYGGETKYRGVLRIGSPNIQWDVSNCYARASIDPSGAWYCLRENQDEEQNMLTVGKTAITVQPLFGTLVEVTCGPVNVATPIEIEGYFELNVNACLSGNDAAYSLKRAYIEEITPGSSYDHYATYITEQYTTNCSGGIPQEPIGDGWVLLEDDCAGSGTATYGRPPRLRFVGEQSGTTGKYWDNTYEVTGADTDNYDNARSLEDLLENLITPECGLTVRSQFFDINPSGATPSGSVYDTAGQFLPNVLVFQKSDIKRPDATDNATVANWTTQGLLSSLREQFNVRWKVTPGLFRLEHVSYFNRSQGLDLTSGNAGSRIEGLHSYGRDNATITRQERWAFMEEVEYAFRGLPIIYGDCVPYDAEEETTHDLGPVNNNVEYIEDNTDQVSDEGFVFVNAYFQSASGTYHFITVDSIVNTIAIKNGHLSIPHLLDNYHRHDRMLINGNLNGNEVTFDSAQRNKKQVDLQVKMSNAAFWDFDPYNLVKTQMGWGKVERFRYSFKTCVLTLTISHE